MNFTESIGSGLSQYAEFDGRSGRDEFWYFQLFLAVVYLTIGAFGYMLDAPGFMVGVAVLGTIFAEITLIVRRLHDTNRSGWLAWIALVPIIGTLPLIILMLLPGTAGQNKHGI